MIFLKSNNFDLLSYILTFEFGRSNTPFSPPHSPSRCEVDADVRSSVFRKVQKLSNTWRSHSTIGSLNIPIWLINWRKVQPSVLRIQFSSPSVFLGGPGMLSRTSRASWDLLTMTSLSLTAVCIRLTLEWSLKENVKQPVNLTSICEKRPPLSVNLLFPLTAWCWACLWSPQVWSSPSAWLYTARSSLWSRSSELADGARSCRRCCSPPCLALRHRCRRRRPTRCSSAAAWSYGLSPAGPGLVQKHTNMFFLTSSQTFFLP